MPDTNPTVLLGVGGGVAAFKAASVASALRQRGWDVTVAMSRSAQRFVTPLTFSAVTGRQVLTRLFPPNLSANPEDTYPHLYPATRCDICIILPATADMIARIAGGLGDDIVSASILSLPAACRRYYCPAMNVEMWAQGVVCRNAATMEGFGWHRIGPEEGHLACGAVGEGRMAEPDTIMDVVTAAWQERGQLKGKRVLILSGPTVEHLDPVRFISNHSSGKMGKAIALAAAGAGATVQFITGPVATANLPTGAGIDLIHVTSAAEMLTAAEKRFPEVDAAVFAAAVADYTPAHPATTKSRKQVGTPYTLTLTTTIDIAATVSSGKRPNQVCIGFALQTGEDGEVQARGKLLEKKLDGIILNGADSMGAENGDFHYLSAADPAAIDRWGRVSKTECAGRIVEKIAWALKGA